MNFGIVITATHQNNELVNVVGGPSSQLLRLLPRYEEYMDKVVLISHYTEYHPRKEGTSVFQLFNEKDDFKNFFFLNRNRKKHAGLRYVASIVFSAYIFFKIIKVHKNNRLDFLNFFQMDSFFIIPSVLLTKLLRIKIFFKFTEMPKERDPQFYNFIKNWLYRDIMAAFSTKIIKLMVSQSDIIQALNQDIRDVLIKKYKKPEKNIILIPNCIRSADFKGIYKDNLKKFGYVGRLHEFKNIPRIIQGYSMIMNSHPDYELVIIGEGPDEVRLKKQVQQLGLEKKVHFLGFEKKIEKIYSHFDIMVLASFWEGISNVLLEAMASGIPIIASRVTGNTALIEDGKTGLLFDPNSTEDLAEKMKFFIEHPSIREQIRLNALNKVISEYDVELISKKIIRFLKCSI